MELLCYDPYENPLALEMGARYCSLEEIYANADVISLHCPMSEENYHLLNENAFAQMKDGVMIINTSAVSYSTLSPLSKHLNRVRLALSV